MYILHLKQQHTFCLFYSFCDNGLFYLVISIGFQCTSWRLFHDMEINWQSLHKFLLCFFAIEVEKLSQKEVHSLLLVWRKEYIQLFLTLSHHINTWKLCHVLITIHTIFRYVNTMYAKFFFKHCIAWTIWMGNPLAWPNNTDLLIYCNLKIFARYLRRWKCLVASENVHWCWWDHVTFCPIPFGAPFWLAAWSLWFTDPFPILRSLVLRRV